MRKILIIAAIAVAASVGCGSSAPSRPPTLQEALQQSGCSNMHDVYHGEIFTTATAECTLNGTPAEIAVFPGPASQKQWEAAAKAFGAEILRDGDLWAGVEPVSAKPRTRSPLPGDN
jgi:hypothetical protein